MKDRKKYWNENVSSWASLYRTMPNGDEKLYAPRWFSWLYNNTISILESRLMKERFSITKNFIEKHGDKTKKFADIGCGTGIFSTIASPLFAKIMCIDIADESLRKTKETLGDAAKDADYYNIDVENDMLQKSHVSILVGVLPYIADVTGALNNILSSTDIILIQYCSNKNIFNKIRSKIPFLNVRAIFFHSDAEILAVVEKNKFSIVNTYTLGTGSLLELVRMP